MLLSVFVNYIFGICLGRTENKRLRTGLFVVSIVYNVGILIWFKYLNFLIGIVDSLFHTTILENNTLSEIRMPIGISFFTFQILSYVIDVYRKQVEPQKNILKLGLYIAMFPQLIAGPIVRYIDVAKEMEERKTTFEDIYQGTIRFVYGFMKKVLLSNTLSQVAIMAFDEKLAQNSMAMAWMGMISYTLQIYFDFSGYSDMAIGLGRIFGFHFLENFQYPYSSTSVKEFWRRWHISLSSWFRDYIYIPLGGSRSGTARTYRNLFLIFLLTGLWHGASFNFIIWGLWHGFFLVLERWKLGKALEKIPPVFLHIYTWLVVMIGWVFFRAETLPDAWQYCCQLVNVTAWNFSTVFANFNGELIAAICLGFLFCTPVPYQWITKITESGKNARVYRVFYLVLLMVGFWGAVCYMTGSGFNPFIYFRF
ncbi:MAG: MBOAT family protein [Bacteroides sp.]|nr:MBOAT family protein [Bacteroides sp.]MCM1548460.1 MBOAT family protein [Clostridium sp.]